MTLLQNSCQLQDGNAARFGPLAALMPGRRWRIAIWTGGALMAMISTVLYANSPSGSNEFPLTHARYSAAMPADNTRRWFEGLSNNRALLPPLSGGPDNAGNLWAVLAGGVSIEAPQHKAIEQELRRYQKNSFWTARELNQAGPFLYYVVNALKLHNMPVELALLPVIESNYNPAAHSQHNAAGLWQLLPNTGRALGLQITHFTDERRHIEKSTEAALEYLRYLHDQFDDWPLAIAAYNAGPARVRARLRRYGETPPDSIWDLDLPSETRRYVAKFFALRELIEDPASHDIQLRPLPEQAGFVRVAVPGRISLNRVAELADTDVATVEHLNRDLLYRSTAPDGPHEVALPVDVADTFETNLAHALADNEPLYRPVVNYVVRRGDTISEIAANFHLSTAELRQLNNLRGSRIRIGQKLKVYDSSHGDTGEVAEYRVRKGDTLSEIASRYGVDHTLIARQNNISNSDALRAGKVLVIPAKYTRPDTEAQQYTVKPGDTLSEIAHKFSVSVNRLRQLNPPLADGHKIIPGQKVSVPQVR
ncbi:LysM peptidoglycan-binding domain-containing protein [Granulosicoccaceae sp. 1_MG-2023]|nr:LysM peptidoglycan-binding domain-containing protein [Granulosicoccaceae sp. 1_MG-2023]